MERKKETTEREGKKKNTGQGDGRRTRRDMIELREGEREREERKGWEGESQ